MDEWGRRERSGERVEIELTTSEPRSRKITTPQPRTSGNAEAPPEPPAGDGSSAPGDQVSRRSLALIALGVGLGALVIGWALGRSGDGDTATDVTPTPTTLAVTTTERITDTVAPPVTTARPRPSTTTTTTLPAGTPVDVLMSPSLRELPYELAVTDYSGSLHRIDLPAATVRTYPSRRSQPPFVAFRTDGSVLTYSPWGDGSPPTIVTLDGETTRLEAGQSQQLIVDGIGDVWQLSYDVRALQRVDDQFEPIGESLTMNANQTAQADPAGGVLISGSNGTFSYGADGGARRVSTGDVVAAGVDTLVAYECSDDFACGHVVIDRATGSRTVIDVEELARTDPLPETDLQMVGATRRIVPTAWFGASTNATVAGRFAVFGVESTIADGRGGSFSFLIVDLESVSIAAHVAGAAGYLSGIVLSPDGLTAFAPSQSENGSSIIAIELATGAQMEYEVPNADAVFGIAVRLL